MSFTVYLELGISFWIKRTKLTREWKMQQLSLRVWPFEQLSSWGEMLMFCLCVPALQLEIYMSELAARKCAMDFWICWNERSPACMLGFVEKTSFPVTEHMLQITADLCCFRAWGRGNLKLKTHLFSWDGIEAHVDSGVWTDKPLKLKSWWKPLIKCWILVVSWLLPSACGLLAFWDQSCCVTKELTWCSTIFL